MSNPTLVFLFVVIFSGLSTPVQGASDDDYRLAFAMDLRPTPSRVKASMTVRQDDGQLKRVRIPVNDKRYSEFSAKRGLERDGADYAWKVPARGGRLEWTATVTHKRKRGAYDARLGDEWALFRAEDVFPAMASAARSGAKSKSTLKVTLPDDWGLATPYERADDEFLISNPARRFDRPTGWIIAGDLGVRIDRIADVRVTVAAGKGSTIRRQDYLALMSWNLPHAVRLFPKFPENLLIVVAPDPFWRGGLSGPGSMYIHTDRPLISENGTSTLLHELFHVGFRKRGKKGADWIVEGLAEYYSVEWLLRSGTVTDRRNQKTHRALAKWARDAGELSVNSASGPVTARAVGLFVGLDREIRKITDDKKNLDHVVRALAEKSKPVDLAALKRSFKTLTNEESKILNSI